MAVVTWDLHVGELDAGHFGERLGLHGGDVVREHDRGLGGDGGRVDGVRGLRELCLLFRLV